MTEKKASYFILYVIKKKHTAFSARGLVWALTWIVTEWNCYFFSWMDLFKKCFYVKKVEQCLSPSCMISSLVLVAYVTLISDLFSLNCGLFLSAAWLWQKDLKRQSVLAFFHMLFSKKIDSLRCNLWISSLEAFHKRSNLGHYLLKLRIFSFIQRQFKT